MSAPGMGSVGSPGSLMPLNRHGYRIGLAETQEISRERRRRDGQVALHVAGREAGGLAGIFAGPDSLPDDLGFRGCLCGAVHRVRGRSRML